MESFYNGKLAASQLRKYRDKGPIASTQTLIDALKAEGIEGSTLLDISGGIGAIQHELLAPARPPPRASAPPPLISRPHERRATAAATATASPLTPAIAETALSLPSSFRGDPADRLIYATAIEHGSRLITKDHKLRAHPHPQTVALW
jgi:hypothetical protein